jgi:hypothetical protein
MTSREILELIRDLVAAVSQVQQEEVIDDSLAGEIAKTLNNLLMRLDTAQEQERVAEQQQIDQQEPISNTPTLSNDAQLLWVLSGRNQDVFLQYLQTYSTRETQELLNDRNLLQSTIATLSRDMPVLERQKVGGISQADLQSSNIWGTAYDSITSKMLVKFQGGGVYEYSGIPRGIYQAFISGSAAAKTKGKNKYGKWWVGKTPSLGAAMHEYVKRGKFPFRKLS